MDKILYYYINIPIHRDITPYLSNRYNMQCISVTYIDGYNNVSNTHCVSGGKAEAIKKAQDITQQLNQQIVIKPYVGDTMEMWQLENDASISFWAIKQS